MVQTLLENSALFANTTTILYPVKFVRFITLVCAVVGPSRRAETMISEEIESVQNEADEIEPGWSQSIWPLAMQLR